MCPKPRIIRSISDFRSLYPHLKAGDLVLGLLPLKPGEEIKLLDLQARGVRFFPEILAQWLSRSKAAQAEVLREFMVPGTCVVYSRADLAACLSEPGLQGEIVCKADRGHLGLGVSRWPRLESLVSLAAIQPLPYPLVIQPLVEGARDLRAVVVGGYAEAYERVNPNGFRKNLFQGGSSRPVDLSPELLDFCRRVMARGRFPYAVLDLLVGTGERIYLSEINLKAGLKGSRLGQAGYREQVRRLEEEFARKWENSLKTPA